MGTGIKGMNVMKINPKILSHLSNSSLLDQTFISRPSRCPQVSVSERVVRWFQKTLTGK